MNAIKLQENALKVVHSSISEMTGLKGNSNRLIVLSADYYEYQSIWLRFRVHKENHHKDYVFEKDFFSQDVQAYCDQHHDLNGQRFDGWWADLEWDEKQIICEAFLRHLKIMDEMNKDYKTWIKQQAL